MVCTISKLAEQKSDREKLSGHDQRRTDNSVLQSGT